MWSIHRIYFKRLLHFTVLGECFMYEKANTLIALACFLSGSKLVESSPECDRGMFKVSCTFSIIVLLFPKSDPFIDQNLKQVNKLRTILYNIDIHIYLAKI